MNIPNYTPETARPCHVPGLACSNISILHSKFSSFVLSSCPSRSLRVFIIAIILAILNAVDLELTLLALSHGLLFEANPIAAFLLSTPAHFIIYKITLATMGLYLILLSRRTALGELAAILVCSVNVIIIYQWMACFSWYQAAHFGGLLP